MIALAKIAMIACLTVDASVNLLQNPDLTVGSEGNPASWEAFVAPMDGAWATVAPGISEDSRALELNTPRDYKEDTVNNWSQALNQDLAGKTVRLSAWIRSEAAGEASIWLQCFDSKPLRLIGGATTNTYAPVHGTAPWTPVSLTYDVPPHAKAVVVRCILRGAGKAWFGDLRVVDWTGKSDAETDPFEAIETAEATDPIQSVKILTDELHTMIRSLEDNNRELQDNIQTIRRELAKQRREIAEMESAPEPASLETIEIRHPLVPYTPEPSKPL